MATALPDAQASGRAGALQVTIAAANIYLPRETCDTYFPDVSSIALLERDGRLLVVPLVHDSAGGMLLKIRNRHGDRVIHAQEFFRDKGFAEVPEEQQVAAHWSSDSAALVIADARRVEPKLHT